MADLPESPQGTGPKATAEMPAEADLAIRNNQDQVDLLHARYAVRRAELDVKTNPILSEIDRKKNLLALDEAKRRLVQLQSDIKSRQEQAEAQIDSMREQRRRSLIDVLREKLHSDGDRIHRDIFEYAALSQHVMQLSKIISESVKRLPDAPSIVG